MLATDANNLPIRELGSRGAHSIKCPDRPIFAVQRHVEKISCSIRTVGRLELPLPHYQADSFQFPGLFGLQALIIPTNHPFPECTAHPLGICIAESGASLL